MCSICYCCRPQGIYIAIAETVPEKYNKQKQQRLCRLSSSVRVSASREVAVDCIVHRLRVALPIDFGHLIFLYKSTEYCSISTSEHIIIEWVSIDGASLLHPPFLGSFAWMAELVVLSNL